MITLKNVLVATDFSEPSDVAFTYGRELASRFGARLHVVHVVENISLNTFGAEAYASMAPDLQQQLEDDARRQLTDLASRPEHESLRIVPIVLASISPTFGIIDYAKNHDIDLVVMGTHGRGAFAHLVMGSVAERVVRLAPCPVLTIRHPEREFVKPDQMAAAAHV